MIVEYVYQVIFLLIFIYRYLYYLIFLIVVYIIFVKQVSTKQLKLSANLGIFLQLPYNHFVCLYPYLHWGFVLILFWDI